MENGLAEFLLFVHLQTNTLNNWKSMLSNLMNSISDTRTAFNPRNASFPVHTVLPSRAGVKRKRVVSSCEIVKGLRHSCQRARVLPKPFPDNFNCIHVPAETSLLPVVPDSQDAVNITPTPSPPSSPAPLSEFAVPPTPWTIHLSNSRGRHYYFNNRTGDRCWVGEPLPWVISPTVKAVSGEAKQRVTFCKKSATLSSVSKAQLIRRPTSRLLTHGLDFQQYNQAQILKKPISGYKYMFMAKVFKERIIRSAWNCLARV
jgi:hypothetical protein